MPAHEFVEAIRPLLELTGAELVPLEQREPGDVVLFWDDQPRCAVRPAHLEGALERLITGVERELGTEFGELSREDKQLAVALLHQRGAFTLRKSVEDVAEALGVSRFTVYNYLDRTETLQDERS